METQSVHSFTVQSRSMSWSAVIKVCVASFAIVAALLVSGCSFQSTEGRANSAVKVLSWKLDLNDGQRAKLEEVKKAYLDAHARQRAERQKSFNEAKEMLVSEKLDAGKTKAIITRRNDLIMGEFDSFFAKFSDFHSSLSVEQKNKAAKLMDEYGSKWAN